MIIRIKSQREGYRRCGAVHPKAATDYAADHFTAEELERLQADPVLAVMLLDGELETSGELDGKPGTDDTPPPAGKEPGKEARPVAPKAPKAAAKPKAPAKPKAATKAGAKPAAKPAEKPASEPAPGGGDADGAGAPGAASEEQGNADGGQE